jgi:pyruvyltransferase
MPHWNEYWYFIFIKIPTYIYGKLKGNLIRTHWGRGLNNFGDCLSPDILRYYGFTPIYSQVKNSEIILAGTVLQWIPEDYDGIILGTGGVNQKYFFPKAKILGVRGKITLNNIQNRKIDLVLGDPGLIMNLIYPEPVKQIYELGIIPHFVDKDHRIVEKWKNRFKDKALIIDVLRPPSKVIKDIKKCKHIISSSLHGLIIADAYSIPNIRFIIKETQPPVTYKFADYYSVLNNESDLIKATGDESLEYLLSHMRLHIKEVKVVQENLNQLFLGLKSML